MTTQEQVPVTDPIEGEVVTDSEIKAATDKDGDFRQSIATLEDPNAHPFLVFMDPNIKNPIWQVATMLADSQLVPDHFQGRPADCFLILQAAGRLRVDPLLMLQKTYIVHGKPGFESTFLISLVNQRGGFAHGLRFRFEGERGTDSRSCIAWTTAKDGEVLEAPAVTMEMAQMEGWTKNPKYRSMPDLMLTYRAGGFFSRIFCPDVTMGFLTLHELQDMEAAGGEEPSASDKLRLALDKADGVKATS